MKVTGLFALCAVLAIPLAPAIAANIDISKDQLVHQGEYAVQTVATTNNTGDPINTLKVACRFFRNKVLLNSGMAFAESVQPHQTVQIKVVVSNARDADTTDCNAASAP